MFYCDVWSANRQAGLTVRALIVADRPSSLRLTGYLLRLGILGRTRQAVQIIPYTETKQIFDDQLE